MNSRAYNEGMISLERYHHLLQQIDPITSRGHVRQVIGNVIEAEGPAAELGELCLIDCGGHVARAEVVGFRDTTVLLMALDEIHGIRPGSPVEATGLPQLIPVGPELLGRVLDPLGTPLDGKPAPLTAQKYPLDSQPPSPMVRNRIQTPLETGIRAIDSLLTLGQGQRMGIFSGSGVGKSTLMGMVARYASADVNVIGLIGERGREVRDFIEQDLGPEGMARSVVIAVTSDQPALLRIKGAFAATAVAEYFRDQGQRVMLMMDSVTRFAMARREVGLAIGEPPATRGYTPSVFTLLPKLLERSGNSDRGSITALYTVLVEGDDTNEPISDTVRGILDGHIFLSRAIAARNHYPAIDVLNSLSRLAIELTTPEHRAAAGKLRQLIATYQEAEDLIAIGAYVPGSSASIDRAMELHDAIDAFLCQEVEVRSDLATTLKELLALVQPPPKPGYMTRF